MRWGVCQEVFDSVEPCLDAAKCAQGFRRAKGADKVNHAVVFVRKLPSVDDVLRVYQLDGTLHDGLAHACSSRCCHVTSRFRCFDKYILMNCYTGRIASRL